MALLARKPEYQDASTIIGTIVFAYSMQVLITLLIAPLYSNMNIRTIFLSYLVGGVINTLLNLLLIPGSGIVGAAISTAVSYLAVTVLLGYANYRVALFPFFERRLLAVLLFFLVGWASSLAARGWISLAGSLAIDLLFLSVVIFFATRRFLRPDEMEILCALASDVQNRFRKTV
jgi:O-antigen/teichoic acid export membrane protein